MTNGTYVGPSPVAPAPENLADTQRHALSLWDSIDAFVSGLDNAPKRVFWVGAGGSLVGLQAAQFVMDRDSLTPSVAINSDEFY